MALPPRLFCDTSFFYACLDRGDIHYNRASQLIEEAAASAVVFCTTVGYCE
jgi:predicted nucleic acid-binding protein